MQHIFIKNLAKRSITGQYKNIVWKRTFKKTYMFSQQWAAMSINIWMAGNNIQLCQPSVTDTTPGNFKTTYCIYFKLLFLFFINCTVYLYMFRFYPIAENCPLQVYSWVKTNDTFMLNHKFFHQRLQVCSALLKFYSYFDPQ